MADQARVSIALARPSTYPWLDSQELVKRLYDTFGPRRLMWGTDWPIIEGVAKYEQALYGSSRRHEVSERRRQELYAQQDNRAGLAFPGIDTGPLSCGSRQRSRESTGERGSAQISEPGPGLPQTVLRAELPWSSQQSLIRIASRPRKSLK
jgi:hypothetical protein